MELRVACMAAASTLVSATTDAIVIPLGGSRTRVQSDTVGSQRVARSNHALLARTIVTLTQCAVTLVLVSTAVHAAQVTLGTARIAMTRMDARALRAMRCLSAWMNWRPMLDTHVVHARKVTLGVERAAQRSDLAMMGVTIVTTTLSAVIKAQISSTARATLASQAREPPASTLTDACSHRASRQLFVTTSLLRLMVVRVVTAQLASPVTARTAQTSTTVLVRRAGASATVLTLE